MNWKEYETMVYEECNRVFQHCEILHDIYVDGLFSKRKRQIGIQVRYPNGKSIIIDAKKYDKKIDVKKVESFIGMVKDVGSDAGIIVSEKGFSKAAINRAHYGEKNVEVDILNLHELSVFQGIGAIQYYGNCGIVAPAPFCWIIDATRRDDMVATMYRRGFSFEEATHTKEWAYTNFCEKNNGIESTDELIELQNYNLLRVDNKGIIEEERDDTIRIRIFKSKKYPCTEITLFREFDDFIVFVVLFSPDNMIKKNVEKMKYFLSNAYPLHVIQSN